MTIIRFDDVIVNLSLVATVRRVDKKVSFDHAQTDATVTVVFKSEDDAKRALAAVYDAWGDSTSRLANIVDILKRP